jgi:cytochrome c peroxidase
MAPARALLAPAVVAASITGCGPGSSFCEGQRCGFTEHEWSLLDALTPIPAPRLDSTNRHLTDPRAVQLGQRLFRDRALAGAATLVDSVGRSVATGRAPAGTRLTITCATCHEMRAGGADTTSNQPVSVGAGWFPVNAPSLFDTSHRGMFFWNGRADSVWSVVMVALEGRVALASNRLRIAQRIRRAYRGPYEAIFGPLPAILDQLPGDSTGPNMICDPSQLDPIDWDCLSPGQRDAITSVVVASAKAIAAYVHQFQSGASDFDRFMSRQGELGPAAIRGARLFVGRAGCIECHSGPLFTDEGFHNLGVPESAPYVPREAECPAGGALCDCVSPRSTSTTAGIPNPKPCPAHGLYDGLARLATDRTFRGDSVLHSDDPMTRRPNPPWQTPLADWMKGAWRTPSLRNVALTAPYMHNGAFDTLEEVIWFYDAGGSIGAAPDQKSRRLAPLGLDAGEVADLTAFLRSLTGDPPSEALLDDAVCGDGALDSDEACDDGDGDDGDGCAAGCGVEDGWRCEGQPSRCQRI